MSNEIRLEGLDDFVGFIDDLEITQEYETKAIKKAMVYMQKYVQPKAPQRSGKTEKSVKIKIKKNDFSTEGIVYVNSWYAVFQNFRNMKQKGNYIGWFDRAVEESSKQALDIISKELMK